MNASQSRGEIRQEALYTKVHKTLTCTRSYDLNTATDLGSGGHKFTFRDECLVF